MKDKRTYSLTAKERKAKRAAQAQTPSQKKEEPVVLSREEQEAAFVRSQKRSRNGAIIAGAVACIAIIMIIIALIVPVVIYIKNPYAGRKEVIARFDLSNGMVLEFVIEENEYDIAATNFIFLAKNGFFDNTVFFDAQNGWLRFGGFVDQPSTNSSSSSDFSITRHRADDKAFCDAFSALPNESFRNSTLDKFRYKLNPDGDGDNDPRLRDIGVLAFLYSNFSTEFQMSYQKDAVNLINNRLSGGGIRTDTLKATMVGHALDDKTIENLIAIQKTATLNTKISTGFQWQPPQPNIYIKTVKVYNLNKTKWDKFDFIKYVYEEIEPGKTRLSDKGWGGVGR